MPSDFDRYATQRLQKQQQQQPVRPPLKADSQPGIKVPNYIKYPLKVSEGLTTAGIIGPQILQLGTNVVSSPVKLTSYAARKLGNTKVAERTAKIAKPFNRFAKANSVISKAFSKFFIPLFTASDYTEAFEGKQGFDQAAINNALWFVPYAGIINFAPSLYNGGIDIYDIVTGGNHEKYRLQDDTLYDWFRRTQLVPGYATYNKIREQNQQRQAEKLKKSSNGLVDPDYSLSIYHGR